MGKKAKEEKRKRNKQYSKAIKIKQSQKKKEKIRQQGMIEKEEQKSKAIKRKQLQKKEEKNRQQGMIEKEEQKPNEVKTKKEERREFIVNYLQYGVEEQRNIRLYREGIEQKKKEELWRNIDIDPKLEREKYTSEYKGIKHKYDRER